MSVWKVMLKRLGVCNDMCVHRVRTKFDCWRILNRKYEYFIVAYVCFETVLEHGTLLCFVLYITNSLRCLLLRTILTCVARSENVRNLTFDVKTLQMKFLKYSVTQC